MKSKPADGRKWKSMAKEFDCAPFIHPVNYCLAATSRMEPIIGSNEASWVLECKKGTWLWCGEEDAYLENSRKTLALLEKRGFFEKVDAESRRTARELEKTAAGIRDAPLSGLGDRELVETYRRLFDKWLDLNAWGHVVNLADFDHNMLTEKITGMLEKRIEETGAPVAAAEAFGILATPAEKTGLQEQEENFYGIVSLAAEGLGGAAGEATSRKLLSMPYVSAALDDHARKYDWLNYNYSGPTILDRRHFAELAASELRQGVNGEEKLREMREKQAAVLEKQAALEKALKLGKKELHWIRVARSFMYLKALRKETVFYASRCAAPLVGEIAGRLGITPWLAHHLAIDEIEDALAGKKKVGKAVEERAEYCVVYHDAKGAKIFTGDEARAYSSRIYEQEAGDVSELKGTPACAGTAKGIVKIVVRIGDIAKMDKGDILVSSATNPNLLPAMKRAAAIVTDEGGITCHAAIVSRELGIPCIVGTKVATKALKDGDVVEVDAVNGKVTVVKRA